MAFDQLFALDTVRAMHMDSLSSTHPIQAKVEHPSQINQLFDAISYSKVPSERREESKE